MTVSSLAPSKGRFRFWLIQTIVVLGTLLVAIILAETVARKRYPGLRYSAERQARPEGLFIQFDSRLGWSNIPGRVARFQRVDFDTQVTINDDGFRGTPLAPDRSPGIDRVAILGDSYVFGHGVEDHETFSAVLDRMMSDVEVGNFGVTGYSTDQELLLLEDTVLGYDPDLIVLLVCRNDILDNGKATAWGLYRKPRFTLVGGRPTLESEEIPRSIPAGMRVRRELRRRFVLYDLLAFKLAAHNRSSKPGSTLEGGSKDAVVLTRALLAEFCALCSEREIPVLLGLVPPFPDLASVEGLPPVGTGALLDLQSAIERYQTGYPDSAIGFTYDSHWNPRGHRLVAETLRETIDAHGWLPSSQSGTDPASVTEARTQTLIDPEASP